METREQARARREKMSDTWANDESTLPGWKELEMRIGDHQASFVAGMEAEAPIARQAGWDEAMRYLERKGYLGAAAALMPIITDDCHHSIDETCDHCAHYLDGAHIDEAADDQ